jgi:hypothetical protein
MSYTSMKIDPLGKENFDTWKIQIEALLIKNDSWKYVNGTIPKPKEPPEAVTTWESNDAKARSDLILTICPSELKQIKNCPTSKDIWNKLHSVYQSQGPARKAMLLKTLILLKMNLANSWSTKIVGSGTVKLSVEEHLTVRLDETLYVPDLRSNLLSVGKLTEHGYEVIFRRTKPS